MSELTIGSFIRGQRAERGITREQLAVAVGVSSSTIARLELGDIIPKHEIMRSLATVLGMSLSDLYAAVDERIPA